MALSDPQSLDIGAGAVSLPRVSTLGNSSTYQAGDGLLKLALSHQYGKRTRRVIRVDASKLAADPFIPAQNSIVSMSCYMVFDLPVSGYTPTEALGVFNGLSALQNASSDAVTVALLGGQS
jgi:hypothetical protein